jgi:hypothetical protein
MTSPADQANTPQQFAFTAGIGLFYGPPSEDLQRRQNRPFAAFIYCISAKLTPVMLDWPPAKSCRQLKSAHHSYSLSTDKVIKRRMAT